MWKLHVCNDKGLGSVKNCIVKGDKCHASNYYLMYVLLTSTKRWGSIICHQVRNNDHLERVEWNSSARGNGEIQWSSEWILKILLRAQMRRKGGSRDWSGMINNYFYSLYLKAIGIRLYVWLALYRIWFEGKWDAPPLPTKSSESCSLSSWGWESLARSFWNQWPHKETYVHCTSTL